MVTSERGSPTLRRQFGVGLLVRVPATSNIFLKQIPRATVRVSAVHILIFKCYKSICYRLYLMLVAAGALLMKERCWVVASVTQAGGWKSNRMPMRYGEHVLAARAGRGLSVGDWR